MIWRVANAINVGDPINLDRILGGSYNTRSVLETLIALTPEFYFCYPGRIKDIDGHSSIEHGHKHLVWLPDAPQSKWCTSGKSRCKIWLYQKIPMQSVTYDNLILPANIGCGRQTWKY